MIGRTRIKAAQKGRSVCPLHGCGFIAASQFADNVHHVWQVATQSVQVSHHQDIASAQ